jgi:hypothetical protein
MIGDRNPIAAILVGFIGCAIADAATMTFFNDNPVAILVTEGPTWDKIQSNGFYFTYTRDKFFNNGSGRYLRVPWP